jgi:hypothetical protein
MPVETLLAGWNKLHASYSYRSLVWVGDFTMWFVFAAIVTRYSPILQCTAKLENVPLMLVYCALLTLLGLLGKACHRSVVLAIFVGGFWAGMAAFWVFVVARACSAKISPLWLLDLVDRLRTWERTVVFALFRTGWVSPLVASVWNTIRVRGSWDGGPDENMEITIYGCPRALLLAYLYKRSSFVVLRDLPPSFLETPVELLLEVQFSTQVGPAKNAAIVMLELSAMSCTVNKVDPLRMTAQEVGTQPFEMGDISLTTLLQDVLR